MNTFVSALATALLAAAPHAANAESSAPVDEQTTLLLDGSGHVSVVGSSTAYFLQALAGFVESLPCAVKIAVAFAPAEGNPQTLTLNQGNEVVEFKRKP